jgi:DNA polymerase-1
LFWAIQSIYEECGYEFNLNSPKQLAEILFDKLGLPVLKRTKSGAPSTDKGSLEELALYGHDVAQRLVEYSQMDTLRGSFVKKIPLLVNSKDNRLHCSFNADVTRTGRLSSSDPNLQNQPNNKKYPVRKAYIPAKGYKFIILDYSQIEPRIMAHQSRDPKMCAVFNAGSDIYTGIATELGVTRDVAKVIQLAMSYGMGADKLAAMLRQPLHYAERKISEYKATYKVFFHWKKDIEASVRMNGYVETMFGRRRVLPDIKSTNKGVYFSVLRKATNTPIQGSAADIIKIVMNRMHKRFKKEKWDAHLLLSVHDELLIEVHEDIAEKIIPSIIDIVENTVTLDVPLKCELKLCDDWSQMKDKSYPEWGTAAPTIYLPTYEDLIIYGVA